MLSLFCFFLCTSCTLQYMYVYGNFSGCQMVCRFDFSHDFILASANNHLTFRFHSKRSSSINRAGVFAILTLVVRCCIHDQRRLLSICFHFLYSSAIVFPLAGKFKPPAVIGLRVHAVPLTIYPLVTYYAKVYDVLGLSQVSDNMLKATNGYLMYLSPRSRGRSKQS